MNTVNVTIDCSGIDEAIEKTSRLLELLQEAQEIVNSLFD